MISNTNKISILYVDDEEHNLQGFKANFRKFFLIYTANSITDGEAILNENTISVLIIDHRMLIKSGDKELSVVLEKSNKYVTILLTTFADITYLENAVSKGKIYAYFPKPWNDLKLKAAIEEGYQFFSEKRN